MKEYKMSELHLTDFTVEMTVEAPHVSRYHTIYR
jgi:hypothetical protein